MANEQLVDQWHEGYQGSLHDIILKWETSGAYGALEWVRNSVRHPVRLEQAKQLLEAEGRELQSLRDQRDAKSLALQMLKDENAKLKDENAKLTAQRDDPSWEALSQDIVIQVRLGREGLAITVDKEDN